MTKVSGSHGCVLKELGYHVKNNCINDYIVYEIKNTLFNLSF